MGGRRLPRWHSGKEPTCQSRRHKRRGFDPWVRKIPWRRTWQPTPVFLPGKFYGQRSLAAYSPGSRKELDTNEPWSAHTHIWLGEGEVGGIWFRRGLISPNTNNFSENGLSMVSFKWPGKKKKQKRVVSGNIAWLSPSKRFVLCPLHIVQFPLGGAGGVSLGSQRYAG